ncbi:uncharacterized protein LOC141904077 [Tubulanus polymorphus]|uniref:uncharacterized protein LOC141904077 n=1 Tax=Tubulanus polymorphus TaxID=672921 RepID=UPI003DA4C335
MIPTLIAFIAAAFGVCNAFYIEKRDDVGAECGCLPRQFGGNYEFRFLDFGRENHPNKDLTTFILEGRIVINMDELKYYVTIANRKRAAGFEGKDEYGWYGPLNYALMGDLTKNKLSMKTGSHCMNAHYETTFLRGKKVGKKLDSIRCYARNTDSSTVSNGTDDSGKGMTFVIRETLSELNLTYSLPDCHLNEISGIKLVPRRGEAVYPKFDIKIDKLDAKELDGVKLCDKPMKEITTHQIPSLFPYPFNTELV